MPTQNKCEMCLVANADSEHHLFPSDNNKPKAMLCDPCHDTIHRTFTNKELTKTYNNLVDLIGHPVISKWLDWRRKHPRTDVKVKNTKEKRKRGRYA